MKITRVNVYQVDLPLLEDKYAWSDGKKVTTFDSTVVEVVTDSGITGYGEVCPLGPYYLPSYAAGVRAGLKELIPHILGENPLELGRLNYHMDYHLKGHPYVKSGVDVACWDILGKFSKLPLCTLLGGRYGESFDLYRAISQRPPAEMVENVLKYREEGYRRFQLKLGGDPDVDIERIKQIRAALQPGDVLVCDANTGWLQHQAKRVAAAVSDLDVYIEQPCVTYEECLGVRRHSNRPFILDENVDDIKMLLKVANDNAADVINLKISKMGGLTKTKQARDLCVDLGFGLTLEDTWGGEIATAAIIHLNQSTPEKNRFSATDFCNYHGKKLAHGVPEKCNGKIAASNEPGLGVTPIPEVLGSPVISMSL